MDEEIVETKRCPLCEKDIELSKFRMHDIGCSRANYKCKECNQCVPKAEREEHEEEEHAIMTCPYCSFSAPKHKYGNHEANCALKPKACEFCGEMIKHTEWQAHYNLCGSKTYQCATCGGWVKNMDKAAHVSGGGCQRNLEKKKKEEDDKQRAELERFQQERLREMEKEKKLAEKKEAEERERQRRKEKREQQIEAIHGVDDFDEFDGVSRPMAQNHVGAPQQIKPVQNSIRQNHPKITTTKPTVASGAGGAVQNPYMPKDLKNNGHGPVNPTRGVPGRVQQQNPVVNNRNRMGGPTANSNSDPRAGMGSRGGPSRPTANAQRPAPQVPSASAVQQQQMKPGSGQRIRTQVSNMVKKISPKNRNAPKVNIPMPNNSVSHPTQQMKAQQPLRPNPNPPIGSSLGNGNGMMSNGMMNDEELNAALIQQMMEEDESEMLANQFQNEAFGGGGAAAFGAPGGGGAFGAEDVPNVRQADAVQEEQLIGGPDSYYRAQRHQARPRRNRDQPQPPQVQPESDAQLQEIEAELNRMQGVTQQQNQLVRQSHSDIPFDAEVPAGAPRGMPAAAHGFGGGGAGLGDTMSTEQAMLNKVIEDSLKSQQHVPSADYDEEAELRRILEASKNDV